MYMFNVSDIQKNAFVFWLKHKRDDNFNYILSSGEASDFFHQNHLTHFRQEPHICVSELVNIGSGNGLSPVRRQAITWTNAALW